MPQNDRNCVSSAAASAGTTSSTSVVGSSDTVGAISTPANPASTLPTAQFTDATTSGECARLAATTWFSATAVVARPKLVYRYTSDSAAVSTTPIAKMAT